MRLLPLLGLVASYAAVCAGCGERVPDPIQPQDAAPDVDPDLDAGRGRLTDAEVTGQRGDAHDDNDDNNIQPCKPGPAVPSAVYEVLIEPDEGFELAAGPLRLAVLWFQIDPNEPDPAPVTSPVIELSEAPRDPLLLPMELAPPDPMLVCDRGGCTAEESCPCQGSAGLAMAFVVLFDDIDRDGAIGDRELVGLAETQMVIWLALPYGEQGDETGDHFTGWLGAECLEQGFHLMNVVDHERDFDSLQEADGTSIRVRAASDPDLFDFPNLD